MTEKKLLDELDKFRKEFMNIFKDDDKIKYCHYHITVALNELEEAVKSHLKGKVIVDEKDLPTRIETEKMRVAICFYRDETTHGEAVKGGSDFAGLDGDSKMFKVLTIGENKLKKLSQPKDERTSEHSEDKTRKERV